MKDQEYYFNDFHRKRSKAALAAVLDSKKHPLSLAEMVMQGKRLTQSKSKLLQLKNVEKNNGC